MWWKEGNLKVKSHKHLSQAAVTARDFGPSTLPVEGVDIDHNSFDNNDDTLLRRQ